MCFYTTKHQKPKFATEDIECWKYLNIDGSSFFQYHKYVYGVVQPNISIRKNKGRRDNEYEIHEGYHSYVNYIAVPNGTSRKPSRFIIPKGTRYYHNINEQEYVSETIIKSDK
jgi:hypothetical protein